MKAIGRPWAKAQGFQEWMPLHSRVLAAPPPRPEVPVASLPALTQEWRGHRLRLSGRHLRPAQRATMLLTKFTAAIVVCVLFVTLLTGCGDQTVHPSSLGITYSVTNLGIAPLRPTGGDLIRPDAFVRGIYTYGQVIGELNRQTLF